MTNVSRPNPQLELMSKVVIFKNLPEHDVAELSRRVTIKRWQAGAVIISRGEPTAGLHIVFRGQVKLCLFGDNGREMTLSTLQPGEFFGELGLLDNQPHCSNAVAVSECTLLSLSREALWSALARQPHLTKSLFEHLAAQVRRANETIGNLALNDVRARLTKTLLALAEARGEYRDDGMLLRYRPTQQELAHMVGTCRETVSRTLSSMAREGLVVAKGRSLLLTWSLIRPGQKAA
jgi:CRP-like cAMP-binding protein